MIKFIRDQHGVSAIEFAFVFFPFMLSILVLVEVSRLSYITTALDLIISESARSSSLLEDSNNFENDFERRFKSKIESWPLISRDVNFTSNIKYCASLTELTDKNCTGRSDSPLAIYNIEVDMSYIISVYVFPGKFKAVRNIVFVQEFNRKKKEP